MAINRVLVTVTGSNTVAADNDDYQCAVTDWSTPTMPVMPSSLVPTSSDYPLGLVVDCSGTLAAIGGYQGDSVAIYDISKPASPRMVTTLSTGLGGSDSGLGGGLTGIGALSFEAPLLLVGEFNGPHIVLLDITKSDPIVYTISADAFTDGGIASIVLRGSMAIMSGQDGFAWLTNANSPNPSTPWTYVPAASNGDVNFQGTVVCDFDGFNAAVGDSVQIAAFGLSQEGVLTFQGQTPFFSGVTWIAVLTNQIAAGSLGASGATVFTVADQNLSATATLVIGDETGPFPNGPLKFFGISACQESTARSDLLPEWIV